MHTVAILVFTPANVISACAAIATKNPGRPVRCIAVICRFPGQRDVDAVELIETNRAVLKCFPYIDRIVTMSDEDLANDIALGETPFITKISASLGSSVDEIYYTHDVVGIIYQSVCLANPKAERTLYGDGFGWICHRDDSLPAATQPANSKPGWLNRIKNLTFAAKAASIHVWSWEYVRELIFVPDCLSVAIPIEKSDRLTKIAPLLIVTRSTALDILNKVSSELGLLDMESHLLSQIGDRKCLLLVMSNWSEADMATAEGEIDIYMEMLRPHLTDNCVVLAKAHPGCADIAWRFQKLAGLLEDKAELLIFPAKLKRFPLELFGELLRRCTIVAHSSVLFSARYFYGGNAVSSLTHQIITRYLKPEYHDLTREDLDMDAGFVEAIRRWNGKDVIISAKPTLESKTR